MSRRKFRRTIPRPMQQKAGKDALDAAMGVIPFIQDQKQVENLISNMMVYHSAKFIDDASYESFRKAIKQLYEKNNWGNPDI